MSPQPLAQDLRGAASLRRLLLTLLALVLTAASLASTGVPAAAQTACTPAAPQPGYRMLFDGTQASLTGWKQSGPGSFNLTADCTLESVGGLGLLWYSAESFASYTLRLDWRLAKVADNSGIFVGFPNTGANTHVDAISRGYEIQIDQIGRNDGAPRHYTGAIYSFQGPNRDTRVQGTDSLGWNTYEITVDNPKITVRLNGVVVNEFISTHYLRDLSKGHIGLQNHGAPDTAYFRNVQIREIEPGTGGGGSGSGAPAAFATLRSNVGIAHDPTSNANFDGVGYSYSALALRAEGVTPGSTVTAGGVSYKWPDVASGRADNVTAAGQTVPVSAPAGATKLGLLTAADHGPVTSDITLNYTYLDADGQTRTKSVKSSVTVSDWTLNGGGAQPAPGNVTAIATRFRMLSSAVPFPTTSYVFAVNVPVDPSMQLVSVTLPQPTAGTLHLFDMAVA